MPIRSPMPFSLQGVLSSNHGSKSARLRRGLEGLAERVSGLAWLNQEYARAAEMDEASFIRYVLELLQIDYQVLGAEQIPQSGPLVVVANHPFGAIEGVILAEIMAQRRPDVRILANGLLQRIPELSQRFIGVDVFGGGGAARRNSAPMRQALRWLQGGGALVVFPAGEVAHFEPRQMGVVEPPWQKAIGRLIQHSQASVVPVGIEGRNSLLFQASGLLHPRLRTLLLAREMLNKRGCQVRLQVGQVIGHNRLKGFADAAELIDHLRLRCEMLRRKARSEAGASTASQTQGQPLVEPVAAEILAAEVVALPPSQCLVPGKEMQVYYAEAAQRPRLLGEIGRLRELTFRAVGEGTGRSCDIDLYDNYYLHLFIWNSAKQELVGAYRLGQADRIMQHYGKKGLYSQSLFRYRSRLLQQINPAIELGRSFVREEYQRSFSPLMLLWKGIGAYIAQNPRYKILFGPVSISQSYQNHSQRLLIEYLLASHSRPELGKLVRARRPFRGQQWLARLCRSTPSALTDMDAISDLVAQLEPDGKGIPILLKQYLKLGGRLLAFNVDREFNNAVDGLIMVDLTATDPRVLQRYMGDATEAFLAWHANKEALSA
ncbi:MAG: lysophospholipid acyltransferase family protein [Gammaproteobacteria bacterium]|nr:lysophospholipid acyltransferase family protein [Gammaproteobacteria bacterium]